MAFSPPVVCFWLKKRLAKGEETDTTGPLQATPMLGTAGVFSKETPPGGWYIG